MDELDAEIIAALRKNGRASLADIAAGVGLSAPAVKRRMDRLEDQRVIVGYTVLVDDVKLGEALEAFVELGFAGDTRVAEIAGIARGVDEVRTVFTIAGDPDALVHVRARDMNHLTQVIDRLRRTEGVRATKTLMVLATDRRRA
ncbi:MAG: Lrp/AsnC family transcriptional regulator, leucine-responsive regulatory protein [Solirubrobacteraceae bacterium]|jgi:DNA-binding Lrp family transcriptional regulator|nr:Lrp/AsnC family transcriptional regulator, leucine-responsive regulatory protein [Solirubrobacteraceae bacterium]